MSDFLPPIILPQKTKSEKRQQISNSTRSKRVEIEEPEDFGMTLEGWANHNDEQDDFGKSLIIKKQAYQKACKNTLNNLSEGLSPSKRFSADKGLMLDISINNSEKIPEGIREYKEDEVIKESIENDFFDKSIEVTGSKVQPKLQWPFKVAETKKDETNLSHHMKALERIDKSFEFKRSSNLSSISTKGVFKLDRLERLLKDAEPIKEANYSLLPVKSSKNSVQVNFDSKPFPKQAAIIEKFQALRSLTKTRSKKSNLLSMSPQRNVSVSPLELGINMPKKEMNLTIKTKRSLNALNASQMGAVIISKKRAQRNLKNPFSDTKLSFENKEKSKEKVLPVHESLKDLLEKLQMSNSSLLSQKNIGLYKEIREGVQNENYYSRNYLPDSSKGLNSIGVYKMPMEIKSKNNSPVSREKFQGTGKDPGQLAQIWGSMKSSPMRSGRGGYGHVNSDLDEVVQYLLHNTSNSYHIPLNKTGSNDKSSTVIEQKLNKSECSDLKGITNEKFSQSNLKIQGRTPAFGGRNKRLPVIVL